MRVGQLWALTFLFAVARSAESPFLPAAFLEDPQLARRQNENNDDDDNNNNSCPSGYSSCGDLGAAGACCEPDSVCSQDAANNMACCPSGAVCTGVISTPTPTDTPDETVTTLTPTPTPTSPTTPSTTSAFRSPTEPTAAPTGSTIGDAEFPFVYIPTTFPNQDACIDAYYGCQSQLSECTASLGGAHGVTIGGEAGFGTTREGSTPTVDAQSVCTSLRDVACYGLQIGFCTALGSEGGVPNTAVNPGGAATARSSSALYEILAGLAVSLAGMVAY